VSHSASDWLRSFGLSALAPLFEEHEIDLAAARDLTEDDMRELGIAMGPRKKLLRAIAALDATGDALEDGGAPAGPAAIPHVAADPDGAGAEQRRQVTVLFADISGFTRISAEMDAEETHAMIEAYFAVADEIVRSHGGTVDKHIGDSVMAVFGAPVSHGNEAERALRAALAIHAAMPEVGRRTGRHLQVHIGVASGQVVASAVGDNDRFTVTGASVNLAARLTDIAKGGQTAVSEGVRGALSASADFGPQQSLTIKGFDAPVNAYLVEAADVLDAGAAAGPLFGRARELAQFEAALGDCLSARAGQLICLRGEAGIGKTRLAEELSAIAGRAGMTPHRALVLDFGGGRAQDPARTVVRSLLGIGADATDEARAIAADQASRDGLAAPGAAASLHELLDLTPPAELRGVFDAMDAEQRRRGRAEAFADLVAGTARRGPVFLLIEDVHWADKQLLSQVAEIARRIADAPAILVLTTRIEGDPLAGLRAAGLGGTALMSLDLRALRREEAEKFAAGYHHASAEYVRMCVERAAGNPLFLEQLLRAASSTIESAAVPDSVQSLVQAQMDALAAVDRAALQAASVIGQQFALGDLRRLIDQPGYQMAELVARRLVQPDGERFLFAHALVREGVYGSLLRTRLRPLHRRAADVLGEGDPALRARHLDRAEAPEAAAAYADAALAAAAALADDAALELAERGLDLATDPADVAALMRLRGDALRNLGCAQASIDAFTAAAANAPEASDACLALIGVAEGLRIMDRHLEALDTIDAAERVSADMPPLVRAQIHALRGRASFPLGRTEACLTANEASLALAREAGSPEAEATALSGIADTNYLQGRMKDAGAHFEACVEIGRTHNLARIEAANRPMSGWTQMSMMKFREALEEGLEGARLAARISDRRSETVSCIVTGYAYLRLDDLDRAEAAARRGIALADGAGALGFSLFSRGNLIEALHGAGRRAEARAVAEDVLARLEKGGRSFIGPYALGTTALVEDDPERRRALIADAEAAFDEGCVSHNHFLFADPIMSIELEAGNWEAASRHADRLEAFTRPQPLVWTDFLIERTRALVAHGRGDAGAMLRTRMEALVRAARGAGMAGAARALEAALQPVGGE
jgi:class 3 adenylate cyclase/tetratricopeptide (TPR) repeat protein